MSRAHSVYSLAPVGWSSGGTASGLPVVAGPVLGSLLKGPWTDVDVGPAQRCQGSPSSEGLLAILGQGGSNPRHVHKACPLMGVCLWSLE